VKCKGGFVAKKRAKGKRAVKTRGAGDDGVTVGVLKKMMVEFVAEREWGKFHTPRNLAASVAVEAGELLELFQWLTAEEAEKKCREDAAFRQAVGEELCDVMMYLIGLANVAGIDVGEAIFAKMEKNRKKYPAERYRGWYTKPK
jgi:NTP pyrophosphatase (non-canonical NTP hydrolase)